MKRLALLVSCLAIGLVVMTATVVVPIADDLSEARRAFSGEVSDREIDVGIRALERVHKRLARPTGRMVGSLPVLKPNLQAIDSVATGLSAALGAARDLEEQVDERLTGALRDGRIDLDGFELLGEPLSVLRRGVGDVVQRVQRSGRSRWLLPSVQTALLQVSQWAQTMERKIGAAESLLDILPSLMGWEGDRRYLVVFLNYAEARGSGGIASGVGTFSIEEGQIELGRFGYYGDLDDPPYEKVKAPADLQRRYGRYRIASTHFANATMSPDVPEVARVLARAYERARGIRTDGVLFLDPAGLAALVPEGARLSLRLPSSRVVLTRGEIADYISSGVYEEPNDHAVRRAATLRLGRMALSSLLENGRLDRETSGEVAASARAGHIRFVPFARDELSVMDRLGVSGRLDPTSGDRLQIVVQNFGGDKLDHWLRQEVSHSCDVRPPEAFCTVDLLLRNQAPSSLPDYVTQERPHATIRDFVELYIPGSARLTKVDMNERPVEFSRQKEGRATVVGVFARLGRKETATVSVSYRLPVAEDRYRLDLLSQPMARPPSLRVELRFPEGWRSAGPDAEDVGGEVFTLRTVFDESMTITATKLPKSRLSWVGD